MLFQGTFHAHFDAGALLTFTSLRRDFIDGGGWSRRGIGLFQPLLQQRFQFAHVLETELERLEAADGRLREDVAVERTQRQTDVGLREAQFDAPLFELFGERFEVVRRRVLFLGVSVKIGSTVTVAVKMVVRVVRVTRRRTHLTVVIPA